MFGFQFQNPTELIFGEGQIKRLSALIDEKMRILICYGGGSVKKNGIYNEVREALQDYDLFDFEGIGPNPDYDTLMKAIKLVRQHKINFLLALGGGSVIDGTKFIAAAATFDGPEPWDMLSKGIKPKSALPFGTILTLPATGSEMNSFAVISRNTKEGGHDKLAFSSPLLFPKFSILDPRATLSLPLRQVGNGIVDAFIHTMEQYLTYPADNPLQDRLAEGVLQTLMEEGPKTLKDPENIKARSNFMLSATFALNGMISMGVPQDWATHMIGHEITALYGLDHAQSLAIVFPSLMEEKKDKKREKILQYAYRVLNIDPHIEKNEAISLSIQKTRAFFEDLGVKTYFSDYGLNESAIGPILDNLKKHEMKKLGEHGDITLSIVEKILRKSLQKR